MRISKLINIENLIIYVFVWLSKVRKNFWKFLFVDVVIGGGYCWLFKVVLGYMMGIVLLLKGGV